MGHNTETFLGLLASPAGHAALVFFFFLLIVLFLRKLFGPKGWLRDPKWDEMNRVQRRQEQEAAMRQRLSQLIPLLEREQAVFGSYVDEFCRAGQPDQSAKARRLIPDGHPGLAELFERAEQADPALMYELKREHSLNVLQNAMEIVVAEPALFPAGLPGSKKIGARPRSAILRKGMREPDAVLLLAALYHDLGRFEQLRRYGTFCDAVSMNHGHLSAKLLKGPRFLAGESPETRALTRLTVLMHNRRELPAKLTPGLHPICQALRDADKLDILRIMAAELAPGHAPDPTVVLGLADEPEKYSPALLEKASKRESIAYTELRYVNDLRFVLCGWLNSLSFETSRRILARRGHLESIMTALPDTPEIKRLTDMVRSDLTAVADPYIALQRPL
ncbi:MAG: HD domain-containing protein [Deltaproteobacteria bacterium]|jgi:hypothetical protein|nr:HD domain-containing protein [Deltaproteobacteria bacterium]